MRNETILYFVCKSNVNISTDNIIILSQWIGSVWCRRMSRVLKIQDASPDCAHDFSISGWGTSEAKLNVSVRKTRSCRQDLRSTKNVEDAIWYSYCYIVILYNFNHQLTTSFRIYAKVATKYKPFICKSYQMKINVMRFGNVNSN